MPRGARTTSAFRNRSCSSSASLNFWPDSASPMLQEFAKKPAPSPGGINLTFTCDDAIALYHQYRALGASEPEVGNGLWVTGVTDPDGYKLFFESPTDVAEDTKLPEMK